MIYILENERLKVKVSSMGAELQSIRRLDGDFECLWQGDTQYWSGRATNLFPFCGRNVNGQYTYDGETYEIPFHGFARQMEWSVVRQKTQVLTLQLKDSPETLAQYPFHFAVEITYALQENALAVSLAVHNRDEKELLFSLGGHPGFRLPLSPEESFEDYALVFDAPCTPSRLGLTDAGLFSGVWEAFSLEEGRRLPLCRELFDRDAVFLKDTPGGVTLCSKKGEHSVRMEYTDFPFIGFWQPDHSDAPFLCLEPWNGLPALDGAVNRLEEKPETRRLAVGDSFRCGYTLSFT